MIVIYTGKYNLALLEDKEQMPTTDSTKIIGSLSDLINRDIRELFNFVYLSGLTDMVEFFHCWLRVEHKLDIKEEDRSKYVLIKLS